MEIKWYWLAEQLNLVRDVRHLYNDGTAYEVSLKAGDVFMALTLSLIPILFLAGFLIRFLSARRGREGVGKNIVLVGIAVLMIYAVLLAVGIGPYIKFYPQSGGFIDLSFIEHIIEGIYCAFLALLLFLGGKSGNRLGRRTSEKV